MLGHLTAEYIYDNWVETIKKMYDVTFIDHSMLSNVKQGDFQYIEKYVYSVLREDKFDYIFVYSDGIHGHLSEDFYKNVRAKGIKILTFHADDEPNKWYQRNKKYDHRFDLIASHSKRGTSLRKQLGFNDKALYLPWGYKKELFYRIDGQKKYYDIVYIGWNKDIDSKYIEDGQTRQYILVKLYEYCKKNNLIFRIFGFGWDKHPILKEIYGGNLDKHKMTEEYNKAKIVFNPGYSADDSITSYQTKLRHFEVAGSGVFQLCNYNPELEEIFKGSIAFYNNEEDLFEKIEIFLNNEKLRKEMEDKMYEIAKNSCTMEHRVEKLFNEMNKLYPVDIKKEIKKPNIIQVYLNDFSQVKFELDSLCNNPQKYNNYDAVHFIAGDFDIRNIDYSTIMPLLREFNIPLISVDTFVQVKNLAHTNYHRGASSIVGICLKNSEPIIDHIDYEEYFGKDIIAFKNEAYFRPLINYLVKPKYAKDFLTYYINNDFNSLDKLDCIYSGKIINDICLKEEIKDINVESLYIKKLKKILDNRKYYNHKIAIYGAKGHMAEEVQKLLSNYQHLKIVGFIDRDLAGKTLRYSSDKNERVEDIFYNVYSYDDIKVIQPDIIIIAAAYSGPKIYEIIKHLETNTIILPLYDINDPIWSILI
jgi:spore maturation protein CgeB